MELTRSLAVLLLAGLTVLAQQANREKAAEAHRALLGEYDQALEAFQKAYQMAGTVEEKQKVQQEKYPSPGRFAPRFLQLAREHPGSPVALECLLWVVTHPVTPPAPEAALRPQALSVLQKDHVEDERIGKLCTQLVFTLDPASEEFLRAVLEKTTQPGIQARACASLAANLKQRYRVLGQLKDDPRSVKEYEATWGKAAIAALLGRDADKVGEESLKLFQRVIDKHGDVKHPLHGNLANLARAHLESIRKPVNLDQPAPEIAQEDIEGKPLKLSESRGKVVLLDFWAHSYPACQAMYEYQRGLVKRLASRPFVLVGVNGDAEKSLAQKAMTQEKLTWRSWYDGGVGGPLATRWEIDFWPSLVLIDHKGVIRGMYVGWPEAKMLEADLAKLLDAAEKTK